MSLIVSLLFFGRTILHKELDAIIKSSMQSKVTCNVAPIAFLISFLQLVFYLKGLFLVGLMVLVNHIILYFDDTIDLK